MHTRTHMLVMVMMWLVVAFLEEITLKGILEELIIEKIVKHGMEIEVSMVVETAVTPGTKEGVKVKRSSLLSSSLRSKPVVLSPFVFI